MARGPGGAARGAGGGRRRVTAIPPSRYKVVERGRRLVVIDTLTGQPAAREPVSAPEPAPTPMDRPVDGADRPVTETAPRRIDDRSGAAVFTTSRLYDLKGPREIVIDDRYNDLIGRAVGGVAVATIGLVLIATMTSPWVALLPFVALTQPKVRAAIRQWITARLDAVQADS